MGTRDKRGHRRYHFTGVAFVAHAHEGGRNAFRAGRGPRNSRRNIFRLFPRKCTGYGSNRIRLRNVRFRRRRHRRGGRARQRRFYRYHRRIGTNDNLRPTRSRGIGGPRWDQYASCQLPNVAVTGRTRFQHIHGGTWHKGGSRRVKSINSSYTRPMSPYKAGTS